MKETLQNGKIVIYQNNVEVLLEKETVWLSAEQIGEVFQKDRSTIQRHIKNIVNTGELTLKATCAKNAQVQQEGNRRVSREIPYYNLDMIIAVGYRVNSKRATQFRIWATNVLKQYLTQGYALNRQVLQEQHAKIESLRQAIGLLSRAAVAHTGDLSVAAQVLEQFAAGLTLLDDYDNQQLDEQGRSSHAAVEIKPREFLEVVRRMKTEFASEVFANPKDGSFESSVGQIYQTFGGKELYLSIEEKAAVLLYLIVKNHSFSDGNKRIAAACFLYFLERNKALCRADGQPVLDNKTLATLTLFIAVSKPAEKETVLKVILSVLNR